MMSPVALNASMLPLRDGPGGQEGGKGYTSREVGEIASPRHHCPLKTDSQVNQRIPRPTAMCSSSEFVGEMPLENENGTSFLWAPEAPRALAHPPRQRSDWGLPLSKKRYEARARPLLFGCLCAGPYLRKLLWKSQESL